MNMCRFLIAAATLSVTHVAAAEPSRSTASAIDHAREALSEKLEEAKADGFILKKEILETPDSGQAESAIPIRPTRLAFPATLRDGFDVAPDCLTLSGLKATAAAASVDPLGRIERLLNTAESEKETGRNRSDARIAETYLAIGFFDEAYAIASKATGPRAAAISIFAATGLEPSVKMPEEPAAVDGCGELHHLAAKISHANETDGLTFDDSDFLLIEGLPSPLAQSILDYISVAAIDQHKLDIAARLREERARLRGIAGRTHAELYSDAALLLAERPNAESAEMMLTLTADPGPLRARALKELVAGENEAMLDASRKAALYANLEDAHAASPEGGWKVALGDALINHKMKIGDWRGALQLFGRMHSKRNFSDSAPTLDFGQILGEKLLGGDKDDALAALSIVAENSELSAKALDDSAFRAAAEGLAQLGAAEILESVLANRGSRIKDDIRLRVEAKIRSGDVEGLKALVAGREGDAELLSMTETGLMGGLDGAIPKFPSGVAVPPESMETVARMAWAQGDWNTAATLFDAANRLSPRIDLAEHAALASLASGAAEYANENDRNGYSENRDSALAHFFSSPPSAESAEDLRRFSDGIVQEIEFVRKRTSP